MFAREIEKFFVATAICNEINETVEINEIVQSDPEYGQSWMFFPDGEGNAQIAYLVDPGPMMIAENSGAQGYKNKPNDEVTYYLYRE